MLPSPTGMPAHRRHLIYLSGPPGAGKSTLMRHLTRFCPRDTLLSPFAHDILHLPLTGLPLFAGTAVELGRRREKFSGTDALSMSVIGPAEDYLARAGRAHPLILGEGDRLANLRFFNAARNHGWHVTLVHLDAPQALLNARCAARGSTQNEQWRRGRITKARNLVDLAVLEGFRVEGLDGRNGPPCLTRTLTQTLPILAALFPADVEERAP